MSCIRPNVWLFFFAFHRCCGPTTARVPRASNCRLRQPSSPWRALCFTRGHSCACASFQRCFSLLTRLRYPRFPCPCKHHCLTTQSRGRRISSRSSPHAASRGAPHFYVSALHYFVMQSFLPTPPPLLSITARGLAGSTAAQRLAVSSPPVAPVLVGTHRPQVSAHFTVSASLLALGQVCFSRRRSLVRLGLWARCTPFFVGRQHTHFGGRGINPSFPVCANPAVEGTPNKQPFSASCRFARRPSLLR